MVDHPDAELMALARAAIAAERKASEAIREEDEIRTHERDLEDYEFQSVRVRGLLEEKDKIETRVFAMRATTIEGMRAKAEILTPSYYKGVLPPPSPESIDECLLASIVADLTGLATGHMGRVTTDLH